MALSLAIYKPNRLYKIINSPLVNFLIKNVHNSVPKSTEVDALDSFTSQLLQRKVDRWETIRIKRKSNDNKTTVLNNLDKTNLGNLPFNICDYTETEINKLMNEYFDSLDAKKLLLITNQLLEYKICPSPINLQKLLSFLAQNGDRDTIKRLQILVEEINPALYKLNAKFLHFLAEATWMKGNVGESLKLFEEVYEKYSFLRRKLKLMIKYLIANVITERSEAILVLVCNFTENIALKYGDYFPLACVWQACFLSEWYADQCRAAEILDKHEKLCPHVANRIQYVVNYSLKNHQTEVVHRLFELLLKYDMKSHYSFILQSLFNYRYWQNDLRSCTEIVQWSLSVDVPLSTEQHEQFLSLLLKQNINDSLKVPNKPKSSPNFQLKF